MKSVIIVLSILTLGSLGYGVYQQSQVGSLRAELKEVQGRLLAAEQDGLLQRARAEDARMQAQIVVERTQQILAECEKRRK